MRRFLTLALLACGCSSSSSQPCTTASECEAGEVCVDSRCQIGTDAAGVDAACSGTGCECMVDAQCTSAFACVEGRCVDGACFFRPVDEMCAAGERCIVEAGCVSDRLDAGTGDDGGAPDDGGGTPDGSTDGAVDGGSDAGTAGGAVGDPCTSAASCMPAGAGEPLCIDDSLGTVGRMFMGGYCSSRCDGATDTCGAGAVCARVGFAVRACLKVCTSDADCRAMEGYVCGRARFVDTTEMVCIPGGLAG